MHLPSQQKNALPNTLEEGRSLQGRAEKQNKLPACDAVQEMETGDSPSSVGTLTGRLSH